jgi:hypothetical protein
VRWTIGLPGTNATQHELSRIAAVEFTEALCAEDESLHFEVTMEAAQRS